MKWGKEITADFTSHLVKNTSLSCDFVTFTYLVSAIQIMSNHEWPLAISELDSATGVNGSEEAVLN